MKFVPTAAIAAVAALSVAGAAHAGPAYVNVTIKSMPVVSLWLGTDAITLTMDGSDPGANNLAIASGSLYRVNNVPATISVTTIGALPAPVCEPPVPGGCGGGIQFHIFLNTAESVARAAFGPNAYAPAGAVSWDHSTLGETHTFPNLPISTTATNMNMVYAAASPGEAPLVADYQLEVTYTIAPSSMGS